MSKLSRGVITIAYGAPKYLRMGRALAFSIRRHDKTQPLAVVTDTPGFFADEYDYEIPIDLSYGSGVVQKLHLDKYTPFHETLFVDSDCLLYGPAAPLWQFFGSNSIFGARSLGRLTYGDTEANTKDFDRYLDYFGLDDIPNIKGGFYYFNDSEESTEVFEKARHIFELRDDVGLTPFKNAPVADEVVIGTAMELCGVQALPPCAEPADTFLGPTRPIDIDVLEGKSRFTKSNTPREPTAIHYAQNNQKRYCYLLDVNRLELEGRAVAEWRARARARWEYARYWGGQKWKNVESRIRKKGPIGLLPGRFRRRLGMETDFDTS